MTEIKLTKLIVNCETNEVIEREFTPDEYAQYEIDQSAELSKVSKIAAKEAARQALLEKLGITAEEAKLLLG